MEKASKFCIAPFTSVRIGTRGYISPCCRLEKKYTEYHDKKRESAQDGIAKYHTSDYMNYLRKKFLNDERPAECRVCWLHEAQGYQSFRMEANRLHKILFQKDYERYLKLLKKDNLQKPSEVSLELTNLCNLKCMMCSGTSSSQLLKENHKLGFELDMNQKDFDWRTSTKMKIIQEIVDNENLEILNLSGGETFMIPEIFHLLKKLKGRDVKVLCTTNATQYNKKIVDTLQGLKNLHLMFSIESTGKQNDYLRFPSNWDNVQSNVKNLMKDLPNATLNINCVIQNLNLLYADQLVDFAFENKIYLRFDIIDYPHYLKLTNLPLSVLEKSYEKLNKLPQEKLLHTENIKTLMNNLRLHIKNYKLNNKLYQELKTTIITRDKHRKISIFNYMPELAKELFA
tara:strand:+ start:113 stop:1309 length:1197 start_codon:yes stop_codon:yes gene_type:complete